MQPGDWSYWSYSKKMLPGLWAPLCTYFQTLTNIITTIMSPKIFDYSVLSKAAHFYIQAVSVILCLVREFRSRCFQTQAFKQPTSQQPVIFSPRLLRNYNNSPGFEWMLKGKTWKCVVSNYILWAKKKSLTTALSYLHLRHFATSLIQIKANACDGRCKIASRKW